MLQGSGNIGTRSRRLRQDMSLPEVLLWRLLRQRPGGLKFRRQHPSGPYVADFYCHEARLIVEIDGEAHNRGEQPARDSERDAWFQARGLQVIRIPARDVLNDTDAVADSLMRRALLLRQPSAGPPPHASRGENPAGAF